MEKDRTIKKSIQQKNQEEGLMQQGVDSRALFATFIRKLPILLLTAVAGAVLGSGLHLLITLIETRDVMYVSETEYYVAFAEGKYEAKAYYNDFTWNDVLATNPILGKAMELLGDSYDRDQVKNMITADILSDVRYLTITVRGHKPQEVEAVSNALAIALEEFGTGNQDFDSITQIEDSGITQEEVSYFGWRAALLGAVIVGGIAIFVIAFRFCMGSVLYTKGELTRTLGLPVYGMTFQKEKNEDTLIQKQTKMLERNLKLLTEQYAKVILTDASDGKYAGAFLQRIKQCKDIDAACFAVYGTAQELSGMAVLAVIPFGKTYREKITDELNDVRLHGGNIVGAVLAEADLSWMKIYYAACWDKKEVNRV